MALQISGLVRCFPPAVAINQIDASFEEGSVTVLLGANGAGKSTLLRLIAGELAYGQGKILLDGKTVKPTRKQIRRQILLLESEAIRRGLNSHQSAADFTLEVITDYQLERESLADEAVALFERLNLIELYSKSWNALSKGQRYKMLMVGMFLARPKVWLLDEPYSCGLDANGLEILNAEIKQHQADGGIVIFSSQWPQEAKRLADRVIVINNGEIAWSGKMNDTVPSSLINSADASLKSVLEQVGGRE